MNKIRLEISASPQAPSLSELFIAFATMALSGFGGVMPWARRVVVEQRQWMTADQFNEAFAVCQFLPGPNIVNFSIVFGSRMRGLSGALVCLLALIGPPILIVLILGVLYARYGEAEVVRRMLAGLAAAAAGLLVAMAAKMAGPLLKERNASGILVAAIAFAGVGMLGWPLYWIVLGLVPLSIAMAWWEVYWRRG